MSTLSRIPSLRAVLSAARLAACRAAGAAACLVIMALAMLPLAAPVKAADIIQEWGSTMPPAAPELSAVTVSPKDTALLVLDIEELTCNAERRPRCLESVPAIASLMARARAAGMPVLHSLTSRGTRESILPQATPLPGEPVVGSSVDKFRNTVLEDELNARGVTTVIVTGTAAHGAVLHTATGAAQRGMTIILPVDGISAETPYIEQAAVWLLLEGPATRGKTTLTRTGLIEIQ